MYQSLYKRYRPRTFSSIVGQEKVVEILKNQIIQNKIGHAYLFTGVRGTGKTSIAKIMAQAINCENLQEGNPCNSCETCRSILEARNSDIIEMDAASNNGVDDIRSIKEEISFLPTSSKCRVYIIDEVHMLSTGAFNALLKTLEEPPSHVKFILATTEPQKLPATIISRCQRFEFTKISDKKLYELLRNISNDVNMQIEENAITLISMLARGSARDGISILESVSNQEGLITVDSVRRIVGIPSADTTITIFENIIKANSEIVIENINKLLEEGKEPVNILTEVLNVFSAVYMQTNDLISIYNDNEISQIKKYFELDKIEMYRIIKEILDLISELKFIENKNVLLIAGIINISEKCRENKYIKKSLMKILDIKDIGDTFTTRTNVESEVEVEKEKIELPTINEIKKPEVIKVQDEGKIVKEPIITEEPKENKIIEEVNSTSVVQEKQAKNIQILDTVLFRRELLQMKKMPMFVALNNAKIILEDKIVKIDLSKETSPNNLNTLNNQEALDVLTSIGRKILNKDITVEYIFE